MGNITFAIIKPDAVRNNHTGLIYDRILKARFNIIGAKLKRMTKNEANEFYSIHAQRPFYNELTDFMSSGNLMVLALKKDNAVNEWRKTIGATNPELIKRITIQAPGIDVQSYLTPRTETPKELAGGNIDFAIDPPIHSDTNLRNKKIYQDDYVLVVNKKHPIAKQKKVSLDDYLNLSHIHISKRNEGLGHVDTTLNRLGITRRIALKAQHFLVAPYIIDQSNLAMTTIKSFSKGRDFKIFQLPFSL